MGNMLEFIKAFLGVLWEGVSGIFVGIFGGLFQMFNFPEYYEVFWVYSGDWNAGGWVVAILLAILVVAILAALVWLIVWGLLRLIRRFRKPVINQDLLDEIHNLKKQIVKLTREKDRILSMKVHAVGDEEALAALEEGEEGAAAEGEEKKQTGESRFF